MRLLLFSLLICISFSSHSQNNAVENKLILDTIKDFRIKIDAGCSFYSYDSIDLNRHQYVFVISANKTGFINIKGYPDYIYLKRVKVHRAANTDLAETFIGQGYTATLITKQTAKREHYPYNTRTGTLKINGKLNLVIKVHGAVDEL